MTTGCQARDAPAQARAGTWLDRPIAGDAHGILSGAHLAEGELEDAVSRASRNVEMNPDSQQAYVRRALARRQTEGERAVVEECDRIAALPLKDPEPLAERGSRLYEFCRRPEAALADFAKAIEAAKSVPMTLQKKEMYHAW